MDSALPSEVWHEFVSGDCSRFYKLFKGYYKGLYGYGLKMCNDPALVEDGIQELFESLWKRRDKLGHISSPNVYLFVSLRRSILKAMKKQQKKKGIIMDRDQENFSIHFDTEELIIRNESKKQQQEELQKALNQLSNQQKEVIYLHFYNGLSYSEIEEILSINRQSVRNHMYRGMETLRSVLSADVMRLVISLMISLLFSLYFLA